MESPRAAIGVISPELGPAGLRRVLFRISWPVSAEMALQTVTQVVDMAMVGRLGAASIAAVGLSFRPFFVAQALFLGLGVAATAMVARAVGGGRRDEAARSAEQAISVSSLLALGLALLGFAGARGIVTFMGGTGPVVDLGHAYMRGLAPGLFCLLVSSMVSASLRGAGDTRTTLKVNIVVNILNVVGNYALIFGRLGFPALGVYGAAIATSFARLVGLVALVVIVLTGRAGLTLSAAGFGRWHGDTVKRLFRVGFPAALERLAMSTAQVFHLKMIAGLGTVAVAAASLTANVEQFSFMPAIGMAVAASTMVGQNLGAGRPAQAARAATEAIRLAVWFMGGMGLIFLLFPGLLMSIYTDSPELIAAGALLIQLTGVAQIPSAFAFVGSGALRGSGDTATVLWITFAGSFVLRLALTWLLAFPLGLGLAGAWVAVILDHVLRAAWTMLRFRQGRWQQIQV